MNNQWTPRSNRQKGFVFKQVVQYTLFVAFSLWLLYLITQPNRPNGLGRKESPGLPRSTHFTRSGLTLDDQTKPAEENEIPRYSKGIEEVELESLKEVNDGNALSSQHDGQGQSQTMEKSNVTFSDENGIPQHVRDKFVGLEVSKTVNKTRNKTRVEFQNGIATNGTVEEA